MKNMNPNHTKKHRQTLLSVILRNLAVCLFVIAAGVLAIWAIGEKIEDNFWDRTDMFYLLDQEENLKSERYSQLIPGGGYRYSGYFEITDTRGHVLYCSNPKKHNYYTRQVLFFLPEAKTGVSYYIEEVGGESHERFVITRYEEEDGDSVLTGIMMAHEDGRIDYDSIGLDADWLNAKTISILRKNSDRTYLQKQRFTTYDGKVRYLLYHVGNRRRMYHRLEDRITWAQIIGCILLAVLTVIFFCWHVIHLFRQPMRGFISRMREFGETRQVNVREEDIRGPEEFQNIMRSFGSLEEQLVESEAERRKMEEQRQKLLTDISHDLKTPATVIQGYAEMLADEKCSPSEQEQYIQIIRKRSVHLTELINTFFEYSKLNYPGLKLALERDDFCEFFREYFADRYEELEAQGSTVTAEIPEEEMMLSFDHLLMKRLFENILNNSVRHNGGHADLYAGIRQSADEIIVRIGDNGKGIDPVLRETVFSPFVVGNQARTSGEGTGLGLSIARRIAGLHGGSIVLLPEDTDGWKVLFEIRLPKDGNPA